MRAYLHSLQKAKTPISDFNMGYTMHIKVKRLFALPADNI